ncbi:hypothetical protein AK830_g10567 [Neonectria ditissima]|uniref:Uncharacterized protein n=1 Tax=Neonectria ditissima TaxID=78410 RepID=A0A0P7B6W7_9HYPO|nr:hypothetical protein AK830_g10567 [Neonectria ditissima]
MSSAELEDALRPTDETFKAFYERGYRAWYKLRTNAAGDCSLPSTCLEWEHIFPQHPRLPMGLEPDESGLVTAKSTWLPSECNIPVFDQTFQMVATIGRATSVVLTDNPDLSFPEWFGKHDGHLVVLTFAWAYVLSARWAEIIPRASPPEYTTNQAPWTTHPVSNEATENGQPMMVELGNLTNEEARWWAAVLAPGEGWKAAIPHHRWRLLSPWSVTKEFSNTSIILTGSLSNTNSCSPTPASCEVALKYIEHYTKLHSASSQNRAALAAALLLPLAKLDNRKVSFHLPSGPSTQSANMGAPETLLFGEHYLRQLDKLLALSANARGVKAVLGSIFYESNIPANACGAWLQGSMAVLKSKETENLHVLARMFFDRSPHISYLWLGGILTGAHKDFLRNTSGLLGLNRIDLHEAAWTGTLLSFIQEPVSPVHRDAISISRADECRLMFQCQEPPREFPPIYPYPPLGDTDIRDTDLGVQLHAHCPGNHGLQFLSLTWSCVGGTNDAQITGPIPVVSKKDTAYDQPDEDAAVEVDYGCLDRDRDLSEGVTSNLFTWMRDVDGFTLAEREIYHHEWIDVFDSDDESVDPEGDGGSTIGRNVAGLIGGWMAGTMTKRCNSI